MPEEINSEEIKTILFKISQSSHDKLKELAFRETMAATDKKRVTQNDIIDLALCELFDRRKKVWEAQRFNLRSISGSSKP